MNQLSIGKFIAQKRKEHNMTQEQLAEKIGVSNKSVSNWCLLSGKKFMFDKNEKK